MDTSEFVSAVTGRKLYPFQERMLKLLLDLHAGFDGHDRKRISLRRTLCATPYLGIHGSMWIDDLVDPESPIVKTSVSDEQPRHRTTVSKMLPMGLQLVCQSPLYTPNLRYFSDGRQRSESSATEWSDWAPVR